MTVTFYSSFSVGINRNMLAQASRGARQKLIACSLPEEWFWIGRLLRLDWMEEGAAACYLSKGLSKTL
jgi:hypothetical protein